MTLFAVLRRAAPMAFALLLVTPLVVGAEALPTPSGPVVLTIAGKIGETNRPGFDAFEDGFLNYHDKSFERAAAFDVAMLEALGLQGVTLHSPAWPRAFTFDGPWLADLLDAVAAQGDRITVFALDGYAVEISRDDLQKNDWLLAIKRDGAYLGLGQRGPTWLVYQRRDGRPPTHDDESRWPWSVFYIEVE